jgi:hypothetical protein
MSRFGSKEELIKAIENQFIQMQNSKLSIEDLELLVEQTRELHERTLILKYKAYEEKVFGIQNEILEDSSFVQAENLVVLESKISESSSQLFKEKEDSSLVNSVFEEKENAIQDEEPKEPIFDFDVFNELSTEKNEENLDENQEDILAFENENSAFQESDEKESDFLNEDSNFTENISEDIEDENDESLSKNESFENDFEIKVEISEENENKTEDFVSQNLFKNILENNDGTTHLFASKLDTLLGAFGFNEKYQCIQDLFNGSSEDFNQAIEVLDNLSNFAEAEKQMEFYVHLNKWDLESDIVAEFVRKIERRYKN